MVVYNEKHSTLFPAHYILLLPAFNDPVLSVTVRRSSSIKGSQIFDITKSYQVFIRKYSSPPVSRFIRDPLRFHQYE